MHNFENFQNITQTANTHEYPRPSITSVHVTVKPDVLFRATLQTSAAMLVF